MFNPWLLVIAAVAAILGIVGLAVALMGAIADRAIGSHHRAAEIIVNSGKVPPAWISKTMRQPQTSPDLESQAKAEAIAKLDALITRFTTSPLVADEETRQVLLGELRQARENWQESTWREIV